MRITRFVCILLTVLTAAASPALAGSYTAGFGAGVVPEYEGSEDSQAVPMVMFTGKYDSGRSFALMGTNMRVNLLASETYSLGPVLNYRMGRDDVDNDQVDAMDEIDDAFELGLYGGININNFLCTLDFLMDVSDEHDGMVVQANAGYRWKASNQLTITPGVFTTYADNDYMDTYFGVNSGNRGTSTLPDYEADSGMKDVGARIVAHYTPWEQWGVMGIASFSSLLNDAKDSPIVDDEGDASQMFFGVMATYRWDNK